MRRKCFFLPLALFIVASFQQAAAQVSPPAKEILLLCSQAESAEWAREMIAPLDELSSEREDIHLSKVFMYMAGIKSAAEFEHKTDSVLACFPSAPDLCVIIGGSIYGMAHELDSRWKGIPIILAGETTYFCPKSYSVGGGKADRNITRTSVAELLADGLNLTLIHAPFMIEQTVELMLTVQPEMERLIFITGDNFQSKESQLRVETHLSQKHPSLEYLPVYSSENTDTDIIELLQAQKYPSTGILYGSWISQRDYGKTATARTNFIHIIETVGPVFAMSKRDLNIAKNLIGYYSYDHDLYRRSLKQRATSVLDDGTAPSSMHFLYLETGMPVINWAGMELYHLDTSLIPQDAMLVGDPKSLWEQHKPTIMWLLFFLLVGMGAFVFLVMRRSIKSLEKANRIYQRGNEMKTAFTQNISHEIRTPLNAIIGFSQLLGMPDGFNTEEEKAQYLEYVMNNSQLLSTMINDMLSVADMEGGYYHVNLSQVSLNSMVRMAIKSAEQNIPSGVKLIKEPGISDDLVVTTDGIRIQQILVNYLTNACKYTESGSITIGSSLTESPGNVVLYVADTGPGIPEDKAQEIFERFVKLNNDKQGAGLGLSVCKMIADNLNAKVWLDTSYKEGSRFVLSIPLDSSSANRQPAV